jgi:hypothetical protein
MSSWLGPQNVISEAAMPCTGKAMTMTQSRTVRTIRFMLSV